MKKDLLKKHVGIFIEKSKNVQDDKFEHDYQERLDHINFYKCFFTIGR